MRLGRLLFGLATLSIGVALASSVKPPAPASVPMATDDRVQLTRWWPTKGTASREEFLGPNVCADCHASKFRTQTQTPMAHAAMRPADSEALRSHDQLTFSLPPYNYQISRQKDGSLFFVTDGKQTISLPLSWAFGLGQAGQTYILERRHFL